jgi:predicted sulfurtransferase
MKRFLPTVVFASLCLSIFILSLLGGCAFPTVQKISVADLNTQLNDPGITVIDVRDKKDWQQGELKIKGAVREDPNRVTSWAGKYSTDKRLVVY